MESNMVKESSQIAKESLKEAFGLKDKGSNGYEKNELR
jgi:hypothetical protein